MNWQTSCPEDQRRKGPTQEQLIARIYRRVLEIEKRQREIIEPLVKAAHRLLNEKETLMRMFDYKDSEDFQRQWQEAPERLCETVMRRAGPASLGQVKGGGSDDSSLRDTGKEQEIDQPR